MEAPLEPAPPSRFSNWDLAGLLGLAALAALATSLWPRLPDPLPTHWGPRGLPDGWTPKAHVPWILFGLPVFTWLLLFALTDFAVPKDPVLARVQRRAMAPLRGTVILGLALILALVVLTPLHGQALFAPVMLGFLALLAWGITLMVRIAWREMPRDYLQHYRWGLFYVNREDPRLLVPKLIGIGWTFNYARPAAWWLTALLLALPLAGIAAALAAAR